MTSDEFRALLFSLSAPERRRIAEAFGVSLRTVQRWSSYGAERRDALRSNPEIGRLSENQVLIGLRGASADLSRPANKGSGEVNDPRENYCFDTFGEAARFAMAVRLGRGPTTFISNAVTRIEVVKFSDGFCVIMDYDASYTQAEGWAERIWFDEFE